MRYFIFLLFMVSAFCAIHLPASSKAYIPQSSQTDEQRAYQTFKQAREAYEAGQWQKAINLLEETIQLLGETKLRIQPMLINSLIKIEDWHEAKKQLNIYFNLQPDPQFVETQQMRAAERDVLAKVAADEQAYNNAKNNPSQTAFTAYLNAWPHGKYRGEANRMLNNQKDEDDWAIANGKKNTAAYYTYLDKYPNGNHASYARNTIARWDKTAYEKAIEKDSQEGYQYYLNNYPRGEYRDDITKRLNNKKDDDLYAYAKQQNTITAYESYVRQYPNGNHSWTANQIIQNSYYNWGVDEYKAKNYYNARKYFQTLDNRYPSGKYYSSVNKYLNKVERKLSMRDAGFIGYSYDSISPIGLFFGRLEAHTIGYYLNFRMNADIFTGYNVLYSIDEEGNNDSPWEDDIQYTGNRKEGNINLSFGLNYPIIYPLYGYVGGGGGYFPVYREYDAYNRTFNGDLVYAETEYFRIQSETSWKFYPEAGLFLKLFDTLILKYGLMYNGGSMHHQLGAGFKVNN